MTGWDHTALAAAVDWLGRSGTRQLLITHHGEVVVERYWGDAAPDAAIDVGSVQKPLTSALVGMLVAEGSLALDEPASNWLGPGWTAAGPGEERRILLRHLLTMTSGLYDDFTVETRPGAAWYYNNPAYHQVRRVVEVATGATTATVFAERIFAPAGMTASFWRDRGVTDPAGRPLAGLHTTVRDLAAFVDALLAGLFPLDPAYAAAMWTASQPHNPAYGLLWWNYDADHVLTPGLPKDPQAQPRKAFSTVELHRRIAPSAPPGMVGGTGMGEQRLHVLPTEGIVVARLGAAPSAGGPFDEALWSRLAPALPPAVNHAKETP